MERKKVSDNFYEDEFCCPCCEVNITSPVIIAKLQLMRTGYGLPITVTSGTRCQSHNLEVGGTPNSPHLRGEAVDIRCFRGSERRRLVELAFLAHVPTIGVKKDCIHLSIDLPARLFTYDG